MMNPPQRIGVIDLGSNTARLVVFSTIPGYAYRVEDEIRELVRLRQGMTRHGLSDQAIARALFTLRLFKRFCDSYQVEHIIPTATSAVREAPNGAQFVEQVRDEIGLELQIIDGEKEAWYDTLGALNEVPLIDGYVLDIGGGSAQVIRIRDRRYESGQSVQLGALALTEQFVTTDPISDKEFEAVQAEIDRLLDTFSWLDKKKDKAERLLVGLGGTIRNLAKIEAKRLDYPLNTLHGFILSRKSVEKSIELFRELPLEEREDISGLKSDRADIILPGAMVAASVMDRLKVETMTISQNGMREGIFYQHFWDHLSYPVVDDVRRFSVLNMARTYNYQKRHANHVKYLAGRLFMQLAPLHGYGRPERELLDAATLLHDVGTIISYYEHHKHTQTLVINSGLAGFTPREQALVALLARYHRRGKPKAREFESLLDKDDERLLEQLGAIIRLAEFLERGRNANVDDVTVSWNDDILRIMLIADEYPAVELWGAERNAADLVESAFERQLVMESTAVPSVLWG